MRLVVSGVAAAGITRTTPSSSSPSSSPSSSSSSLSSSSSSTAAAAAATTATPAEAVAVVVVVADVSESSVERAGLLLTQPRDPDVQPGETMFYVDLSVSIILVMFGGMMSGLTVAYMSFDELNLELLMRTGSLVEQRRARAIARLVKRRHLLLVTLLVSNAAAMEALPIFLDHIVPEYVAIVISVTAVLFFGEIIPQAVFMKYRLGVCYVLSFPVWGLIVIEFIICAPIALLLDCLLGHEQVVTYTRGALRELAKMHAVEAGAGGTLRRDEVAVLQGVLEGHETPVSKCMKPIEKVFMLSIDAVLDYPTMNLLERVKHSRVPVYDGSRDNIVGILLVKRLICVNPNDARPLRTVPLTDVLTVNHKVDLFAMLGRFQIGSSHLAIVREHKRPIGIITLEDVIEALIKSKIMDELDELVPSDVRERLRPLRSARFGQRRSRAAVLAGNNTVGGSGPLRLGEPERFDGSASGGAGGAGGGGGGVAGGADDGDDGDDDARRRAVSVPTLATIVNAAAGRRAVKDPADDSPEARVLRAAVRGDGAGAAADGDDGNGDGARARRARQTDYAGARNDSAGSRRSVQFAAGGAAADLGTPESGAGRRHAPRHPLETMDEYAPLRDDDNDDNDDERARGRGRGGERGTPGASRAAPRNAASERRDGSGGGGGGAYNAARSAGDAGAVVDAGDVDDDGDDSDPGSRRWQHYSMPILSDIYGTSASARRGAADRPSAPATTDNVPAAYGAVPITGTPVSAPSPANVASSWSGRGGGAGSSAGTASERSGLLAGSGGRGRGANNV